VSDASGEAAPVDVPVAEAVIASSPGTPKQRKHLWEVDIVRILTFLCVIGVHTTSHTVAASDLTLYLLLGLLHFTRNVFFALTAFVLVYSYLNRPVPMRKFWPKRFLLVGVPYVVWSLIYFLATNIHTPSSQPIGSLTLQFLGQLFTGTAWYHLYFLLVTMQVYLLLPVILWGVRKTRGHHWVLLGIALPVQLVIVGLYFYWPSSVAFLNGYTKEFFFSYEFFILAGAVAADHCTEFLLWVRAHRPLIGWVTLGTGIVTIGVFLIQIAAGRSYGSTGTPLQPMIMVWGTVVSFAFLAVGTKWADRRRPDGFGTKFVRLASDRSFGIFLSHPLAIWILLWIGDDFFKHVIPTPLLTLVIYLLVIASAIAITEVARRTPLSLPLTGRRFGHRWGRASVRD
jgi:peptidoglycan/LPS O-acetylase OafA/YrhL